MSESRILFPRRHPLCIIIDGLCNKEEEDMIIILEYVRYSRSALSSIEKSPSIFHPNFFFLERREKTKSERIKIGWRIIRKKLLGVEARRKGRQLCTCIYVAKKQTSYLVQWAEAIGWDTKWVVEDHLSWSSSSSSSSFVAISKRDGQKVVGCLVGKAEQSKVKLDLLLAWLSTRVTTVSCFVTIQYTIIFRNVWSMQFCPSTKFVKTLLYCGITTQF